jgi:hypothetical protein
MSQAGLKAGLVGGVIAAVLQLAGLIPCVGCFTCFLVWAAYVGAGVLAAYWLPVPRSAGDGAGAGAIAGAIAGIIGGVFGMIASALNFVVFGGAEAISQIPPELIDMFGDLDIDPGVLAGDAVTVGTVIGVSAFCCVVGLVIAAVLGAVGGVVFAAVQSE